MTCKQRAENELQKICGALNPTSNAVCELDQGHRARTTAM